jgi:D-alanine-D-alanine ligase
MSLGTVLILHSPLAVDAPVDELDVIDQAVFFQNGLRKLGYNPVLKPFEYDLQLLKRIIHEQNPEFVVNLVETIFGDGRLVHLGPSLFENAGIPYTGCPADAIYLTSQKILAKKFMQSCGIPTPRFFTNDTLLEEMKEDENSRFIFKSVWEHASFGLDENKKLLYIGKKELIERFQDEQNPQYYFCEEYIHGREFNISVIGGEKGPEILPPAEIRFHYPDDKPRILGYKAKWDIESFEYNNTVRTFEFTNSDDELLARVSELSLRCWKVFGLKGYARVDFRVDDKNNIFVLEINANPCISPDSGFVAAAKYAGIDDKEVVRRIVEDVKI